MRLRASALAFRYGSLPVFEGVGLDLRAGEVLAVVGPNAAGKTTLLRCLHAALAPRAGTVLLDGNDLFRMSRRAIAREMGVVPQQCDPGFPFTVSEFVRMGRYPHERGLGRDDPRGAGAVQCALRTLEIEDLAERELDELSGGQFRKVVLAQALAQEPRILLLDEPLQHLDLLHQLEVMEALRSLTRERSLAVVVVLHDLNMASRFADRLLLLAEGRVLVQGPACDVLTPETIRRAFGVDVAIRHCEETDSLQVVLVRKDASSSSSRRNE